MDNFDLRKYLAEGRLFEDEDEWDDDQGLESEPDEEIFEGNEFGGMGLIVKGETSKDNDLIDQAVEESGFYGVYNSREDYWFFPEEGDQSTMDRLENELENIFIKKGANVSFEGQFNENLKLGENYKNDYANSEEDYTDSMVMEKIIDIIKYHELDPSDVLEEIGQEFGINFEFGRG